MGSQLGNTHLLADLIGLGALVTGGGAGLGMLADEDQRGIHSRHVIVLGTGRTLGADQILHSLGDCTPASSAAGGGGLTARRHRAVVMMVMMMMVMMEERMAD